jgi:hypothetical protein
MPRKLITLASLALTLSSAGWNNPERVPVQTGTDDQFIVGIFRPDGVIVPFAQYTNRKWINPWHRPQPDQQPDEPDTIADLSQPWYETLVRQVSEWRLVTTSDKVQTVKTFKSIQVCSHCQQVWGLLSNYPTPKLPGKNECVRNLGIALNDKKEARAMMLRTSASAEWNQLVRFIAPEFERAEKAGLQGAVQHYSLQIPPPEIRAKIPLSMLNLYRTQLADKDQLIFYFEASKKYPKPPEANDAGCNNISLLGGWVLQDSKKNLTLLASQFSPTDCDMKEGGLILPSAILQLDGKTFAIAEEDSYEGESYIILEIQKNGIHRVLETYAGSC